MTESQAPAAALPPPARRAALVCWLIFSALYWAGAIHKPFTAHDFYSWVYAERCSVAEILTMKDNGIGHPPLFHLAQKAVQATVPFPHPLDVRLANYLFGSLFVAVFAAFLGRRPGLLLFSCGIAASATTLDTFLLGRMWGLVCLLSLLLVVAGQWLRQRFTVGRLAAFLALLALGFCADYNFVLALPFVALVCLPGGRWGGRLSHLVLAGTIFILVLFRSSHVLKSGTPWTELFRLFYDLCRAPLLGARMLLNFWFMETLLLALAVFFVCLVRSRGRAAAWHWAALAVLPLFFLATMMDLTRQYRVGLILIPLLAFGLPAIWKRCRYPLFDHRDTGDRCLAGMAGGLALLLAVSRHVPTGLIQMRFILILFPLLLVFLAHRLPGPARRALALVLICSGLLYTASGGVSLGYPPAVVSGDDPVVFADVYSWSNQYFHVDDEARARAYIIDQSRFVDSCRVCRMGTDRVPWERFQRVRVVGPADRDARELVPDGFILVNREMPLSRLDHLQFALLHPIYTERYAVSLFERTMPANEEP